MKATVVVSKYARAQGEGWGVDVYSVEGKRSTESRWTTRERAIAEGRKLAAEIDANLCIC